MHAAALITAASPVSPHWAALFPVGDAGCGSRKQRRVVALILWCFASHCFPALAQYSVDWRTIAGGGGMIAGGGYSIEAAIGQVDAGPPLTGPTYSIRGGFWVFDASISSGTNSNPGAPFITQHPVDVTVQVGGSFTLSVMATGAPPLAYQWFKDGALLSSGSPNYPVINAPVSASGQYYAVVTNQAGKAICDIAMVSVFSNILPEITQQPSSQTVNRGSTVTLSVTATGQAPLRYLWRKDGQRLSGGTSPTLVLNNVQTSQAGQYTVLISNDNGEVISQAAVLTVVIPVNEPPRIVQQPQDREVKEGALAGFAVVVDSEAAPAFQWYHSGQPIPSATGSALSVSFANQASAGPYTVVVRNIHGSVTSGAATLIVNAPVELPVLTQTPQSRMEPIGGTATFTVAAGGPTPFSYQWLRDAKPIPSAQGPALVLNNLQASAAGYYSVRVRNPGGAVVSDSALLNVVDPAVLAQTRVEVLRKPDAIRLHTPATEGSFSITKADQVSSGPLAGEHFADGVLTGAPDYAFPLAPLGSAGFFQARVEPTPALAQESNLEDEETETQNTERLFAWENPVSSLAPGSQFEVRGQIVNASLDLLNISGSLELYVVNQRTGEPAPGLAVQPAVLAIQAGHVQGTVEIVGTTPATAELLLKVRIVVASALALGAKSPTTELAVSGLQDFVHGVEKALQYVAQLTEPWKAPLRVPWTIVGSYGEWPRGGPTEDDPHRKNYIHHGIDMSVPAGTFVYPVEKGYLCHIDSTSIWVNHGNGYFSRYLHTWAFDQAVGLNVKVSPDEAIGYTADLGERELPESSSPHLHFEVWRANPTPANYAIKTPKTFAFAVHPLGPYSAPGFTPALTSGQDSMPPELGAVKVVPNNPAEEQYDEEQYDLLHGVQTPEKNTSPMSYLVLRAVDNSNGRALMIDKLTVKPDGLPATTFSIRDATLPELTNRVENPVLAGYAVLPDDVKATWTKHKDAFYKLWVPFDTTKYAGLGDGPKTVRLDLEGMMGEKSYNLRYGALIRSYHLVKTEGGWARFRGEVVLYNGSSNNPACRQFDQVVLKGKGGVISWGNGEDAWQEKPPSPTDVTEVSNSPFGAEFGEVRIFTFDVPASAVGNCDSPDASAPSIQAHMGALPAITHNVFIHSDGSSLALIPTSLKLEAGVPAELAITGLSPNGTRIPLPVRDFQWSVKVVKTGNLMPLPRSQKGTITYWGNPGTGSATPPTATYISAPLVLRAEVDKLSILGLVQGTYNLTATDSLNRSACVRVQVSKTLVPMFGAVYPGPLDAGLQFIAASPAPDAALTPGQEVVVSGTVVKPGGKFSHLCGLLELSLADDSVGSTSLLYMEPHRLQIYDGNVSSKAKIVDLTGMASNPKLTFEIVDLVLHAPEMRPPSPDLSFSIADEVIGSYDGPNKLGSLLKDWLGWELPIVEGQSYYDSFAVFTADVPADEDLLVKFTSGICEPYWQYLAPIYTVGLQMPPGGVLVKPGEPAIVHLRRNPAY